MILCIETATTVCSVALCNKEGTVAVKESSVAKSHASSLTVFIHELLEGNRIKTSDLHAVAVSMGPGSYTGLRIGVSVAKGICYASGIPLIAVPTTLSMYFGGRELTGYQYYSPMIDARRMEVYNAIYDHKGNEVKKISAEVISERSFSEFLDKGRVLFFGDGADKCRKVLKHENAVFDNSFNVSAAHMCKPSVTAYERKEFEDVAYFEPFYLKDFIATIPKKNILGGKKFNT